MVSWWKNKTRNFKNQKSGSVAIVTSVALPLAVFSLGSTIDFLRLQEIKEVTQRAIDSATLSAAIDLAEGRITGAQLRNRALEIFQLNLSTISGGELNEPKEQELEEAGDPRDDDGIMFSQATISDFSIKIDRESGFVTSSTDIAVPSLFSGIFGVDELNAVVGAQADFTSTDLEVAFVLDATGSMRGARMRALQEAMRQSLDLLLPDQQRQNDVRVSIVPYSHSVNLGDLHEKAVGSRSPSARSINNCVSEREGRFEIADRAPEENRRNTLYETDELIRWDPLGCPLTPLVPLTSDRQRLVDAVNSLTTQGFTGGHMGLEWGMNTLSENYADFWPEKSKPIAYDNVGTRKILVFMTDGSFNTSFIDRGKSRFLRLVLGRRQAQSERATDAFCDLAKAEERGIEIFTIAFAAGSRAENLLRPCASPNTNMRPGPHFFISSSGTELVDAFRGIIRQILQIRLVG